MGVKDVALNIHKLVSSLLLYYCASISSLTYFNIYSYLNVLLLVCISLCWLFFSWLLFRNLCNFYKHCNTPAQGLFYVSTQFADVAWRRDPVSRTAGRRSAWSSCEGQHEVQDCHTKA